MNFSKNLLLIAFGGAIGSIFRYLLQYWFGNVLGYSLPWGTLTANLLGSFLIGVVYA
ncbi:CrcB family protein, partial [Leptospira interrogans]